VQHLLGLHLLKSGGYPFRRNDLPPETWRDLGELHHYLKDRRQLLLMQVLAGSSGRRILG